jgi:hypothetical protein
MTWILIWISSWQVALQSLRTTYVWMTITQFWQFVLNRVRVLAHHIKTVCDLPQWKATLIFTLVHCRNAIWWAQINARVPDPDQVGSGSFWLDPDPSRSYDSLRWDLSCSHSNWNLSCGKSGGSDIPDFTSMEALLNELYSFGMDDF